MNKKMDTKTMVLGAVLTALVIILEVITASLGKAGMFRFTFALVPIAIGAATCGPALSAWLGFVFGLSVLLTGDAAAFLAVNPLGTVITVLLKGIACGYVAGLLYALIEKRSRFSAVAASAVVCPVVNTGVFLLGCLVFFMGTITGWAEGFGFGGNVAGYMIFGLVGINFIIEIVTNIILTPVIVRLLNIRKK
ncbi:MAG: ECF transporter S component [Ruminococcaceae bacterium]|nr:ECF transporter S component [Oscillospiraceae bacterium]